MRVVVAISRILYSDTDLNLDNFLPNSVFMRVAVYGRVEAKSSFSRLSSDKIDFSGQIPQIEGAIC